MISHIVRGVFHSVSNLTSMSHYLTFMHLYRTHFEVVIAAIQCDNGKEFGDLPTRMFLAPGLQMMSFEHYQTKTRPLCLLVLGLKHGNNITNFLLNIRPPNLSIFSHHMKLSMALLRHMIAYVVTRKWFFFGINFVPIDIYLVTKLDWLFVASLRNMALITMKLVGTSLNLALFISSSLSRSLFPLAYSSTRCQKRFTSRSSLQYSLF
jgi:hypothetical protein